MRRRTALSLIIAVCCTAALAQAPASSDLILGTWKLNLAKSQYPVGTDAPTMQVRRYEAQINEIFVLTIAGLDAKGNPTISKQAWKYDGKEHPTYNQDNLTTFLTVGAKSTSMTIHKRIDAYTVELTNKIDGKVTGGSTRTVSRDGKTFTQTSRDAQGKTTIVAVFDKQ